MGASFGCCIDEAKNGEDMSKRNTDPSKYNPDEFRDPNSPIESMSFTPFLPKDSYTITQSESQHHDMVEPSDNEPPDDTDTHLNIIDDVTPSDDNQGGLDKTEDDINVLNNIENIQNTDNTMVDKDDTKESDIDLTEITQEHIEGIQDNESSEAEEIVAISNDVENKEIQETEKIEEIEEIETIQEMETMQEIEEEIETHTNHDETQEIITDTNANMDTETTQITIPSDTNDEKHKHENEEQKQHEDEQEQSREETDETAPNTDNTHDSEDEKEEKQDDIHEDYKMHIDKRQELKQLSSLLDESDDDSIVFVSDHERVITLSIPKQEEDVNTVDVDKDETDEEDNEMQSRMILKRYKSQRAMLDDESINILLSMKLTDVVMNIVGDRQAYELPSDEEDVFQLERDLRKITYALKDMKLSEHRKYAKITILKHHHILCAIYTKYCKIGGDIHWLNYDGYLSLLRDVGIITIDNNEEDIYRDVFHSTFEHHSKQGHAKKSSKHSTQLSALYGGQSFHDKDPWTGIWCLVKDKQRIHRMEKKQRDEQEKKKRNRMRGSKSRSFQPKRKASIKEKSELYYEKYKMRKIGDKRIVGCLNNIQYAEIGGTFNKSNYKKAKIEIKFKKRRIKVYKQRRVWCCELIPPSSIIDDIKMKIKWEEINQNAARSKQGNFTLYKHDELHNNDLDIPKSNFIGLSRSEFFDTMLCCSRLLYEKQTDDIPFMGGFLGRTDEEKVDDDCKWNQELYVSFDELVTEYLDEYIYKNHCELERYLFGKEIEDDVKDKLRTYNAVLIKLFKKYASMDNSEITTKQAQGIDLDEWCAMALELCKAAKSLDKSIWKHGGKPSMTEIEQCFTLSKNEQLLNQDEIGFVEFQRCLIIFTNVIFKYHPTARYTILDFHDKLDLLLKWCEKLEAQKIKISGGAYVRSDTLKRIKRKKSVHHNAKSVHQSNQSFASTPSPRSDNGMHTMAATLSNLPHLNAAMNHSM